MGLAILTCPFTEPRVNGHDAAPPSAHRQRTIMPSGVSRCLVATLIGMIGNRIMTHAPTTSSWSRDVGFGILAIITVSATSVSRPTRHIPLISPLGMPAWSNHRSIHPTLFLAQSGPRYIYSWRLPCGELCGCPRHPPSVDGRSFSSSLSSCRLRRRCRQRIFDRPRRLRSCAI